MLSIEALLEAYPQDTQAISHALREMCRRALPDAHEFVYHAAINYAVSASPLDRVCYIAPQRQHVTLGFFFGTHLSDPSQLLEGDGVRMRHVKVRTLAAASDPALKQLVREAWADGLTAVSRLKATRSQTRAARSAPGRPASGRSIQ